MPILCVNVRQARLAPSARLNCAATNALLGTETAGANSILEQSSAQFNCYVVLWLQDIRGVTVTSGGTQPVWEQEILFETDNLDTGLLVELWNKGALWDKLLGCLWIPLKEVRLANPNESPELRRGNWYVLNAELAYDHNTRQVIGTKLSTEHKLLIECHFETPYEYPGLEQLERYATSFASSMISRNRHLRTGGATVTPGGLMPISDQNYELLPDGTSFGIRTVSYSTPAITAISAAVNPMYEQTGDGDYNALVDTVTAGTSNISGVPILDYPHRMSQNDYEMSSYPKNYSSPWRSCSAATTCMSRSPLRNVQALANQQMMANFGVLSIATSSAAPFYGTANDNLTSSGHLSRQLLDQLSRQMQNDSIAGPTSAQIDRVPHSSPYSSPYRHRTPQHQGLPDLESLQSNQFVPKDRPYVHSSEVLRSPANASNAVTSAIPSITAQTSSSAQLASKLHNKSVTTAHSSHNAGLISSNHPNVSSVNVSTPSNVHKVPITNSTVSASKVSGVPSSSAGVNATRSTKPSGRLLPKLDLVAANAHHYALDATDSTPNSAQQTRTHRKLPQIDHA